MAEKLHKQVVYPQELVDKLTANRDNLDSVILLYKFKGSDYWNYTWSQIQVKEMCYARAALNVAIDEEVAKTLE